MELENVPRMTCKYPRGDWRRDYRPLRWSCCGKLGASKQVHGVRVLSTLLFASAFVTLWKSGNEFVRDTRLLQTADNL